MRAEARGERIVSRIDNSRSRNRDGTPARRESSPKMVVIRASRADASRRVFHDDCWIAVGERRRSHACALSGGAGRRRLGTTAVVIDESAKQ